MLEGTRIGSNLIDLNDISSSPGKRIGTNSAVSDTTLSSNFESLQTSPLPQNLSESTIPSESTKWMTLLLTRIFLSVNNSPVLKQKVKHKVAQRLQAKMEEKKLSNYLVSFKFPRKVYIIYQTFSLTSFLF